jgi:hypothetical protein
VDENKMIAKKLDDLEKRKRLLQEELNKVDNEITKLRKPGRGVSAGRKNSIPPPPSEEAPPASGKRGKLSSEHTDEVPGATLYKRYTQLMRETPDSIAHDQPHLKFINDRINAALDGKKHRAVLADEETRGRAVSGLRPLLESFFQSNKANLTEEIWRTERQVLLKQMESLTITICRQKKNNIYVIKEILHTPSSNNPHACWCCGCWCPEPAELTSLEALTQRLFRIYRVSHGYVDSA